jgi:formylglycine-generating enzyme required for sulfatase activity
MIGNAGEWVADWYAPFATNAVVDPVGPPNLGRFRVIKGIGWSHRTRHIASGARDGNNPADLHDFVGFRVLCEATPE